MTDTPVEQATAPAAAPWWRRAVVYQVYIRSFADGDGDGIGDIAGVRSRLPYLRDLGVDAIWVNPWYPSPMVDGGYDVSDYRDIDPLFGTLDDARALIADAHAAGIRLLVDIVPNHTSSEHAWFREALASPPGSRARARYVFRDGRGPHGGEPPNNWKSVFGGSAWTRVTSPDGSPAQWYLHLFDPGQPDLDWEDAEVRAEFESILRFWLDLGADGFRIDVASGLVKQAGLPDIDESAGRRERREMTGDHPHWGRDEVHGIFRAWRLVADAYPGDRVYIGEVGEVGPGLHRRIARYVRPDELHQAFAFPFLDCPWDATDLRAVVDATVEALAEVGAAPTWVLSNHDRVRHATRLGRPYTGLEVEEAWVERQPVDPALGLRRARAIALLMLALPGAAYLYQGEELGLPEVIDLPDEARRDPAFERSGREFRGRDGCRVPIPWAGTESPFGFAADGVEPWLPQPAEWARLSVEAEAGDPASMLELYRAALRLRRTHPGLAGDRFRWLESADGVLAFERGPGFVCIVNITDAPVALAGDRTTLVRSDDGDADDLPADAAIWFEA
jgi:alpha-glucosidase